MKPSSSKPGSTSERDRRIAELVGTMQQAEAELQELTGGQLDAVVGQEGGALLLRQAQEQMRHSEAVQRRLAEELAGILNALPAHVALLDSRGVIRSVNDSWRRFARSNGLEIPGDCVGFNYLEVCDRSHGSWSEEASDVARGMRKVLSGETSDFVMEYPCHSNETERWFRLMVSPLRNENNAGVVVMHIDITKRKQVELQRAELLHALGERVKELKALYRVSNLLRNQEIGEERLLEELLQILPAAMQYPKSSEVRLVLGTLERATKNFQKSPWCLEQSVDTSHGQTCRIEIGYPENPHPSGGNPFLDEERGLLASIGEMLRSHFEAAEARRAMRQAEERMAEQAALLDVAQEAILVKDMEDRVVYWNRGAQRTYGWTAEEAVGRACLELFKSDPAQYRDAWAILMKSGEWRGEMVKKDKQGKERIIEVGWTLVRGEHGEPKAVLAINSDVTERKQMEHQILRTQRMESIGTLAGGIAHDLNNLLSPMLISLQLLREEVRTKDAGEMLNTLESCTRRGAELVKQVLSFARGLEGESIAVNFEIILRDIRQIVRETFPKNIEFKLSTEKDLWLVQGDPTQLHQVIMNLVVNARDAMPHGGRLHLSAENVVLDEVYSGMNLQAAPGPYVRIVVNDSGEGIPPEIIDRIFEPFFTTKETGKGTGLGLSTTMGLVRSHGGLINVYSEPGRGATFKIYLPASTTPGEKVEMELKQTGLPRGNGQQILLVDDEQSIRDVARRTLERFGYRVMTAEHGAEAVALYAQFGNEIDAILCDMAMPVMDGPATIVAIKAINPRVRVIASSGLTENQGVTKALGIGANQFINKPYTTDQLLTAFGRLWEDLSRKT